MKNKQKKELPLIPKVQEASLKKKNKRNVDWSLKSPKGLSLKKKVNVNNIPKQKKMKIDNKKTLTPKNSALKRKVKGILITFLNEKRKQKRKKNTTLVSKKSVTKGKKSKISVNNIPKRKENEQTNKVKKELTINF
ncbi:hypothetical protein RCL_jg3464.t1 [Rhizophagus clarus]|uniref:Uncharacterized protein n=1 Tax=Rhizophagus clarus TaxID=94130 RepID=A0A8H3M6Y1_9GLOM|nr:hypothetical protein RCL_jg3464.t1 [Rhizophagus clarus]